MTGRKSEKKKKRKYSQWKFLVTFAVVMGLFAGVRHMFGIEIPLHIEERPVAGLLAETPRAEEPEPRMDEMDFYTKEDDVQEEEMQEEEDVPDPSPFDSLSYTAVADTVDTVGVVMDSTFRISTRKGAHRVRGVWSYVDCFPDIQDVQIVAAQKHGITPVSNREEAAVLVRQHKLVNICHSPFYTVDKLTHSIPYLVPRAQHLLNTICLNFIDSCQVKGLPLHLPIVTSALRTTDDVANLQRGNKNATTNSCHCYGTTVDIAYNKFMPMTGTYEAKASPLRWNEPMKQVLSEVLDDLRKQGKCYVKYERKQGCFHLTCR